MRRAARHPPQSQIFPAAEPRCTPPSSAGDQKSEIEKFGVATGSSAETDTRGRALQTGKAGLRERKLVAQIWSCPTNCGGSAHGRCVGRSCVCKSGWSGLDCTVESLLMKRCRKLRKAIKRAANAKKRKRKRNRKLAKLRTRLQRKGYTDAMCGLADYVVTKLVAEGSVDDYDDAKRANIAASFAAALEGVEASDVTVVVEPYSSATTVRRAAPPSPPPAHARRPTTSLAPRRRAPTWCTPSAPLSPFSQGRRLSISSVEITVTVKTTDTKKVEAGLGPVVTDADAATRLLAAAAVTVQTVEPPAVVTGADVCGVTGGDGSSCADACGVPNGDASTCADACGVPFGDESTCADACGVPFGDRRGTRRRSRSTRTG